MAKPFALAPNGGGYLIFLFLLLPIPLLYSQLHLVQLSFDLGDNFDLLTMPSLALPRRQWDPGIPTTTTPTNTPTMARQLSSCCCLPLPSINNGTVGRIHCLTMPLVNESCFQHSDPGIWSAHQPHTHDGASSSVGLLRRQWDPGIPKHSTICRREADGLCAMMVMPVPVLIDFDLTARHSTIVRLWLSCQVDASLGLTPSALATVKSIFHYVHPVLSRPTVPNINVFRLPV